MVGAPPTTGGSSGPASLGRTRAGSGSRAGAGALAGPLAPPLHGTRGVGTGVAGWGGGEGGGGGVEGGRRGRTGDTDLPVQVEVLVVLLAVQPGEQAGGVLDELGVGKGDGGKEGGRDPRGAQQGGCEFRAAIVTQILIYLKLPQNVAPAHKERRNAGELEDGRGVGQEGEAVLLDRLLGGAGAGVDPRKEGGGILEGHDALLGILQPIMGGGGGGRQGKGDTGDHILLLDLLPPGKGHNRCPERCFNLLSGMFDLKLSYLAAKQMDRKVGRSKPLEGVLVGRRGGGGGRGRTRVEN